MKGRLDSSNAKNEEFISRITRCREEYEAKMIQLRAMEDSQEQITKQWEAAIQELSVRKDEIIAKNMKVTELDGRIADLEETLQMIQTEFKKFQDKHDRIVLEMAARLDEKDASIDAKRAEIADLRMTVSSLAKDKGKLETTVQQLREQLDVLKRQLRVTERKCPICNTIFSASIPQQDFERHIQGHYMTPKSREELDTLLSHPQSHQFERKCPVCKTIFPARVSQPDYEKHTCPRSLYETGDHCAAVKGGGGDLEAAVPCY